MTAFLSGIRHTIRPDPGGDHGPLPPLLVALTIVTGLVDAFSYLELGHVFVANMTGNVVFLAFALVGSHGFSLAASGVALASFAGGALAGGTVSIRLPNRIRLLTACAVTQSALVATALGLAASSPASLGVPTRYTLIVLLGATMGLQNATSRKLAVPDLTTTVLTLTLTGIAADAITARPSAVSAGRRSTSVVAMFGGALLGAALIAHGHRIGGLVAALVLVAGVAVTGVTVGAGDPRWALPRP